MTGLQLSQGKHITGFQILALTAKLTQTVPIALRTRTRIRLALNSHSKSLP
jgi:hypothetical protein